MDFILGFLLGYFLKELGKLIARITNYNIGDK